MECVLAVDGGNTKTIALIATLDGRIVGAGRAGCGDIYNAIAQGKTSEEAAFSNIASAVTDALRVAQTTSDNLTASAFGMAGADWPEDFADLQASIEARGWGHTLHIQNDALSVLHAGTIKNVGVSIVCGTGSATGARGPDGRIWHSSFWQLDARGSTQLGKKALHAVYWSALGIEQPTTLTTRILDYFGMSSVEEVLHYWSSRLYRTTRSPQHMGGLTPLLLDEAEAGDGVAQRIVTEQGKMLGDIAIVAARRVGLEGTAFPLVLAGSVLKHPSSVLTDAIVEHVRTISPAIQPVRSRFEPVVGLLFTALEMAKVTIDEALLERLVPTLPDAALFETRPIVTYKQ
jgi:N-acetylglucosamine kinase-like BadF-type ATPase